MREHILKLRSIPYKRTFSVWGLFTRFFRFHTFFFPFDTHPSSFLYLYFASVPFTFGYTDHWNTNRYSHHSRGDDAAMPDKGQQQDPRFRKYVQLIERNLQSFDAVNEWADIISFLGRLLKVRTAVVLVIDTNRPCSWLYYYVVFSGLSSVSIHTSQTHCL